MRMRVEHIALWTNDLETMKLFYVKYFQATPSDKYKNEVKQFVSYFLKFDSGARLELMNKPDLQDRQANVTYYGFAHLAFSVGSKAGVIDLTETLRQDGYSIISEPRVTGDGYFESCIADPEGNFIEITV